MRIPGNCRCFPLCSKLYTLGGFKVPIEWQSALSAINLSPVSAEAAQTGTIIKKLRAASN